MVFTPKDRAELLTARDAWLADASAATATYGHISSWNTGQITDMSFLFCGLAPPVVSDSPWADCNERAMYFNDDISAWDTSACTNMRDMFSGAHHFDQDIGSWDTSSVVNMMGMFQNAHAFDQDLSPWHVNPCNTIVDYMFRYASAFSESLCWDFSACKDLEPIDGTFAHSSPPFAMFDYTLGGSIDATCQQGLRPPAHCPNSMCDRHTSKHAKTLGERGLAWLPPVVLAVLLGICCCACCWCLCKRARRRGGREMMTPVRGRVVVQASEREDASLELMDDVGYTMLDATDPDSTDSAIPIATTVSTSESHCESCSPGT